MRRKEWFSHMLKEYVNKLKQHLSKPSKMKGCRWCLPGKAGEYNSVVWQNNKEFNGVSVTVMFCNNQLEVGYKPSGAFDQQIVGSMPIKYCPMCGKILRNSEIVGQEG